MRKTYKEDLKWQYRNQKHYAKSRKIPFLLTFEQWLNWWGEDISRRGVEPNDLCMARDGDKGAYELGNIHKATNAENRDEQDNSYLLGNSHALGNRHTKKWKKEASQRMVGNNHQIRTVNEEQARQILNLKDKMTKREIAEKFGITYHCVVDIHLRRTWRNL